MPAIATKSKKRVLVRKFQMALLGGNRARALFHVIPLPLVRSMLALDGGLESLPLSGWLCLTLELRWRTAASESTVTADAIGSAAHRGRRQGMRDECGGDVDAE